MNENNRTDTTISDFINKTGSSINENRFVKLTLGKPASKNQELKNVYVRTVYIKDKLLLSFTQRFSTKDVVKNYSIEEAKDYTSSLLCDSFLEAYLFTTSEDVILKFNKKRKPALYKQKPTITQLPGQKHDVEKKHFIEASKNNVYLHGLGLTDENGTVIKSMNDKFRQVNRYIEIVDGIIKTEKLPENLKVADMGSGKGYLTFALYDYLNNKLEKKAKIIGIEQHNELVKNCNKLAEKSGFKQLMFKQGSIVDSQIGNIDMLIALHACDTATDDAIFKGIKANAGIIILAPCCYKQLSKKIECQTGLTYILNHGILLERQSEILTDGLRSLFLEMQGYKTRVFEFISKEHTQKNIMITAVKSHETLPKAEIAHEIFQLKQEFGIKKFYLEQLFL